MCEGWPKWSCRGHELFKLLRKGCSAKSSEEPWRIVQWNSGHLEKRSPGCGTSMRSYSPSHEQRLKDKVECSCKSGVLRKVNRIDWAAPAFAIQKNSLVRFISELNKRLRRNHIPFPKSKTCSQSWKALLTLQPLIWIWDTVTLNFPWVPRHHAWLFYPLEITNANGYPWA